MGTRTIFWKRPSGDPLRVEELPPDFLSGAEFLLLDGLMNPAPKPPGSGRGRKALTRTNESRRRECAVPGGRIIKGASGSCEGDSSDVSLFAARQARKAGVPEMLDAGRVREGMLELARLSDYVVGSEEFARELGWKDDSGSFRQEVRRQAFGIMTIILGVRGSVTFADDEIISCPAFPVETVDTTGAGDVFHGGYLFGLLRKWPLEDTIRFASAVAAMKCRKVGGRAGIPRLSEVQQFLQERGIANRL